MPVLSGHLLPCVYTNWKQHLRIPNLWPRRCGATTNLVKKRYVNYCFLTINLLNAELKSLANCQKKTIREFWHVSVTKVLLLFELNFSSIVLRPRRCVENAFRTLKLFSGRLYNIQSFRNFEVMLKTGSHIYENCRSRINLLSVCFRGRTWLEKNRLSRRRLYVRGEWKGSREYCYLQSSLGLINVCSVPLEKENKAAEKMPVAESIGKNWSLYQVWYEWMSLFELGNCWKNFWL